MLILFESILFGMVLLIFIQLFFTRNAYVNGEILAIDGGVLNVLSGR